MLDRSAFHHAVSTFGARATAKLANVGAAGAPEEQLRAPLEALAHDLARLTGLPDGAVGMVDETALADLKTRPDYSVTIRGVLVGFIEVKAPGKGADPRRFRDPHDKAQWNKLKSLPNLIYTDGNAFSLWRDGQLEGAIVRLDGDVESSGAALSAPLALLALFSDFFAWKPVPPRTAQQLAEVSARLCRFLREEVVEQIALGSEGLTGLAADWRALLFPEASDEQFADGYAQAVTFGLLVARTRNIPLTDGVEAAAQALRHTNSLIGSALRLLTDDEANRVALKISLGTLTRVLDAVDWTRISKGDANAWLYFYEDFLEVYDSSLRKRTGSYYTPPEVVDAMTRLVDEALRKADLFDRRLGLASPDVTIADPAAGTGTFLLGALRRIAASVKEDQGDGAVGAAIDAAVQRLIGFELQFGPFVVAQLRLLAEVQALATPTRGSAPPPDLKLFITDALANPFVEEERLPEILKPIGRSRRDANKIKREQPITVVIGNPPYKEKAKGLGGWIEKGSDGREPPLDRWTPPVEWGLSAHAKHLRNSYVYFWRWATWKVFGDEETNKAGIVCFITAAGFLSGPGFEKMRDDLRRSCDDIWIIDCSPEGHQPHVSTRIFRGVQQPLCIVLAARKRKKKSNKPARVHFHTLPKGSQKEKFAALADLSLEGDFWTDCLKGWRDPFLPMPAEDWADYPALDDFFLYDGSGVMPGRTWVIAPDADSLRKRWSRLTREKDSEKKESLFRPHLRGGKPGDKHTRKEGVKGLKGHEARPAAIIDDQKPCVEPTRYGFRSFDRQWIIPDARLINQPNPNLWDAHSSRQVYLTALKSRAPSSGPAATFTGLIPDMDHYKGSFGGRAHPLWRDAAAQESNINPMLLEHLSLVYGRTVGAADVMAYVAALLSSPAFTKRFAKDLKRPGLRVPLTADAVLFETAVKIGREIIWLHAFGERFADAKNGRPSGAPRLPKTQAPYIPKDGAIPSAPEPLPDAIDYDASRRRLRIGAGYVENVPPAVWGYKVSGKQVVKQWFSYRRFDRSRPVMGDRRPPSPLDEIQSQSWTAEYTSDLLDLLHVLGRLVALEPSQTALLEEICARPMVDMKALQAARALAKPVVKPKRSSKKINVNQKVLDFV